MLFTKGKLLRILSGLPALQGGIGSTPSISSSIRRLSTSDVPPKACYMMGAAGMIRIPGIKYQPLPVFLKREPLLSLVPQDRLFGVTNVPYQILDPVRRMLLSGPITAFMVNKVGAAIENPFVKGNVGVHSGIGLMVFKNITEAQDNKNVDSLYHHFANFLEETIAENHGPSSLNQLPPDLETFISDLRDPMVNEEDIIKHPTLMSDELYSNAFEVHRYLLKEAPALGISSNQISNVLSEIGSSDYSAVTTCLQHGLLPQFMAPNLKSTYYHQTQSGGTFNITKFKNGEFMVDLHRHAIVHPVEFQTVALVRIKFPAFQGDFSRKDLQQILRVHYPNYLRNSFNAMKAEGFHVHLDIPSRFPVPDIYLACPSFMVIPDVPKLMQSIAWNLWLQMQSNA